ncbi:MAG: ribonuclease Z [Denitrovibrio sp.]|nr:MAG: ribonuclease Z [Denitrovibrio sp.]
MTKLNYEITQVNSPFEDTAFFMRNVYKPDALLFDCGRIGALSNSDVLSITEILISHTHIDHFYGFDRILRGTLLSGKKFRVFGPPGIIKNVQGKIDSYTWNLIKSYPVSYEVIELNEDENEFKTAGFSAANGFEREEGSIKRSELRLSGDFRLDFTFFDHRVPSVGYRVTEPPMVSVVKEKIATNGFVSGKWLAELKDKVLAGELSGKIEAETSDGLKLMSVGDVAEKIIEPVKSQSVTYITDIAPSFENVQKAIKFANDSTVLLIEGMFMKKDVLHANFKKHLTLDLSKYIYHESGSELARFFHFTSRYDSCKKELYDMLYKGMKGKIL